MIEKNAGRSIVVRKVDIFRDVPSEDIQEDSLSLDNLADREIERAIRHVGQKAFNEQVEKLRLRFLSNRDKKKKTGSAKPLDQHSVRTATAVGIIIKHDQKNPRDSQP